MRWIAGALIVAHGLVTAGIWSAPTKADASFQADTLVATHVMTLSRSTCGVTDRRRR